MRRLEAKEELRDLRALMSSYSPADAVITACGYAVLLAYLIRREQGAGLVLDPHKELLSRVLMLFTVLFIEVIYSLHLSLLYGVHKKRARARLVRWHKTVVATGTFTWLVIPWLPLEITAATVFFVTLNVIAALVLRRRRRSV